MWQLYILASLLFGAAEETIDKATMVSNKAIDHLKAAWIRNTISFAISLVMAILISQAFPSVVISAPIVLLGFLYAVSAITYTVLLKQIEITSSSILASFVPLIFLPIDLFIFNADLLLRQIVGILVLAIGGFIFFYRKEEDIKSITKKQMVMLISIFLFDALLIGFESYLFKDYFTGLHLSEMDFLVNMWGFMFLFLTMMVAMRAIYNRKLPAIRVHKSYIKGSFFSKIADYGNSFFFLRSLTVASTSQVTSMEVFYPMALLVTVMITQKKLNVDLEEFLDHGSLIPKICGVVIICFGAFLAR